MFKCETRNEPSNGGKQVMCTVKSVHKEGVAVNVELNGKIVNGTISPRCYGSDEERAIALAAITPGDIIRAVVRSYDARTKSCSLVLPGFEDLPRLSKKSPSSITGEGASAMRVVKSEEAGCIAKETVGGALSGAGAAAAAMVTGGVVAAGIAGTTLAGTALGVACTVGAPIVVAVGVGAAITNVWKGIFD